MSWQETTRTVDLRSDTVTKPCPAMLQAMMTAEVGDDVWNDDPTVNKLQEVAAEMFGKEAALFCPSGTMTNQIAIKCHTNPGDELLCSDLSHIYIYEGGGISFNSGVQAKLLKSEHGQIKASQVQASINDDDPHYPATKLVCLENTANKAGGLCYPFGVMKEISELCRQKGIAIHLDGARVFNAIVASDGAYSAKDLGPLFDSISICLSKGLGCPVGSLLLGTGAFIHRAKRIRKVLGGGMRQAGFLAAAGLYGLEHNIDRLKDDHRRAVQLSNKLSGLPYVASIAPVESNIVIFYVVESVDPNRLLAILGEHGVKACSMGGSSIRLVTHLDVDDEAADRACHALEAAAAAISLDKLACTLATKPHGYG